MTLPKLNGRSAVNEAVSYRYVPPYLLREAWPALQYGLNQIREQNGEAWIPEDVYSELLHQRADLYMFEDDDGTLVGFSIFQITTFPYDFTPRLLVWIGWAAKVGDGKYGYELTHELKRQAGLTSAVFSTSQETPWVAKHRKLFSFYEVS